MLNVGDLLGLKQGDNPHQWYYAGVGTPGDRAIVADYKQLDPNDARTSTPAASFETARGDLQPDARARYAARYGGVPVGYCESIFQPLGWGPRA